MSAMTSETRGIQLFVQPQVVQASSNISRPHYQPNHAITYLIRKYCFNVSINVINSCQISNTSSVMRFCASGLWMCFNRFSVVANMSHIIKYAWLIDLTANKLLYILMILTKYLYFGHLRQRHVMQTISSYTCHIKQADLVKSAPT